jgi:hypothetical protein
MPMRYADWQRSQLDETSDTQGTVMVTYRDFPYLQNPASEDRKTYPYWAFSESEDEFYEALLGWFFDGSVIKWPEHAVEKGLFRKKYYCARCGNELSSQQPHQQQRLEGVVNTESLPPFSIAVDVPMTTCSSCGLTQVLGNPEEGALNDNTRAAVIGALNNAGLSP